MKRFFTTPLWVLLLLLASLALGVMGCSTTGSDDVSSRPWNSPQGWENGALPGMINQQR